MWHSRNLVSSRRRDPLGPRTCILPLWCDVSPDVPTTSPPSVSVASKIFTSKSPTMAPQGHYLPRRVALKASANQADATSRSTGRPGPPYEEAWITASYHPLAVRRRPNLHGDFIRDWCFIRTPFPNLGSPYAHRPPPKTTC